MAEFYTIYQITNLLNNKIYIGKHQTSNLNDGYMGSGSDLLSDYKSIEKEHFKKEILYIFDNEEEMNLKEAELVTKEFCLREDTYNKNPGGKGGFGYINSNPELSVSKSKKGRIAADKAIVEKYKVSHVNHIPAVREKRKNVFKKRHENGEFVNNYFGNRTDFREILIKANSPEAIKKKKETYKRTKHAQGSLNSQFGTIWITDGKINKKIKKDDVIPTGWYKGRVTVA